MKKLFYYFTYIASALAITGAVFAQELNDIAEHRFKPSGNIASYADPPNIKNSKPLLLNELKAKAVRNFMHVYKETYNPEWSKHPDGFLAWFGYDGISNRVYYDKRGNHLLTIRHYPERNLPPDVRHIVKSKYYDYSISTVKEVTYADGRIIFGLILEDRNTRKVIRVVDGEMTVMLEYVKSGAE